MCSLVEHYIQISYRAGREFRPPPSADANRIPIGVFASTGAGSRGIHVHYQLVVLGEGAVFMGGKRDIAGTLYATQGGYKAKWDPDHGLNVSHGERCSEGRVHVLEAVNASRDSEERVGVQLSVLWEPIRSPFSGSSKLDVESFSGVSETSFTVVFPANAQ